MPDIEPSSGDDQAGPDVQPGDNPQITERVARLERQGAWRGPLPPPDALREYAAIMPDAPERIVRMAESDLEARIARENKLVDATVETAKSGQSAAIVLSLITVVAAIVFFAVGINPGGYALLAPPVVMLIRALLGQIGRSGRDG